MRVEQRWKESSHVSVYLYGFVLSVRVRMEILMEGVLYTSHVSACTFTVLC